MNKSDIKKIWEIEFSKLSVDSSDIDSVFDRIYKKGYYRYSLFIQELNKELEKGDPEYRKILPKINLSTINKLYIADILIRRELFRILAPIEVNIRAAILNSVYDIQKPVLASELFTTILENYKESDYYKNAVKVDEISREKFEMGLLKTLPSKIEKFNNKIKKITDKIGKYYLDKHFDYFIDNIEFNHLAEIFKMLIKSNVNVSEWFDGEINDFVFNNIITIVEIRNAVMHHNVFVRNASLRNEKPSKNIEILFKFVNTVFGPGNDAVNKLISNWSNSYNKYELGKVGAYLEKIYKSSLFDPIVDINDK